MESKSYLQYRNKSSYMNSGLIIQQTITEVTAVFRAFQVKEANENFINTEVYSGWKCLNKQVEL